jgi:AraC-like DNA-binding protein/tetratricopeptide (TPR) repeat protein
MDGTDLARRSVADPPLPRHLKRAVHYLRDNLERKIVLSELVRVTGTSERTLQKQFRQVLGMSPLGYLRRLRLIAARQEILQADCASIADIAMRFGCHHLGRFAADYRKCFGETPSATYHLACAHRHERTMRPEVPLTGRPGHDKPSLLVVPFRTETSAERAMAEALVEHVAAALSHTRAATVRLSVAGHTRTLSNDRRSVGEGYCLLGRLTISGERIRVTVRLVDVAADRHVWGDSFDGLTREPFVIQDRVAEGVLCGVVPAVTQAEVERLNDRPRDMLSARQMTLGAMPLMFAQDCCSLRRLLEVAEEALGKDPGDALSVAMAALAHAQIANFLGTTAPAAERQVALRLSDQAGILDDRDNLVVSARAAVALGSYRSLDEVDSLVTRALAMDPTLGWAWQIRGHLRLRRGDDPDLAVADFERALLLNGPDMPRTSCFNGIAFARLFGKRRTDAIGFSGKALADNPAAGWLHVNFVCIYRAEGDVMAKRRSLTDLRRAHPDLTVGLFGECRPGLPTLCLEIMHDAGLPLC